MSAEPRGPIAGGRGVHDWWPVGAVIALVVTIVAYVAVSELSKAWLDRLQAVSSTLGILSTAGTVAALFVLAAQANLQREGLEEQRKAMELQRLALQDQRKALDEQRRSSHAERFNTLRDAYADFLGAWSAVHATFVAFANQAREPSVWTKHMRAHYPELQAKHVECSRYSARLGLIDRDNDRADIRSTLAEALGHSFLLHEALDKARDSVEFLRTKARAREPNLGVERDAELGTWMDASAAELQTADSEVLNRFHAQALFFAHRALRASLQAEEDETYRPSA